MENPAADEESGGNNNDRQTLAYKGGEGEGEVGSFSQDEVGKDGGRAVDATDERSIGNQCPEKKLIVMTQ